MSASSNSTIWKIALWGAALFLLIKLFPAIKAALTGGGSGSGGPAGSGSGGYAGQPGVGSQAPQVGSPSASRPGSTSMGSNALNQGAQGNFNLADWINGVLQQGWANAQTLTTDNSLLTSLDLAGLQPQALQTLNDLPAWDPNDPNAPSSDWNGDTEDDLDVDVQDDSVPDVVNGSEYVDSSSDSDGGDSSDGGDDGGDDDSSNDAGYYGAPVSIDYGGDYGG